MAAHQAPPSQARTLEWVAISFSNAWKWKVKVRSLSCVRLFGTPWTAVFQAPPFMGFSRQEHWSGLIGLSYSKGCWRSPNLFSYSPHPGSWFPVFYVTSLWWSYLLCHLHCSLNNIFLLKYIARIKTFTEETICEHYEWETDTSLAIFPTQGSNPGLLQHGWILYQLSHQGSQRTLEWVAYSFSSGTFWPRNRTGISCIAGGFFTSWATREAPNYENRYNEKKTYQRWS